MKKNFILSCLTVCLVLAGIASAQTNFLNTLGDNDFNNAANWSNDLPGTATGNHATINDDTVLDDRMAVLSAGYPRPSGSYQIYIGNATTGRLVIPFATKLDPGNHVSVGLNAGGNGRMDVMGILQISGNNKVLAIGKTGAFCAAWARKDREEVT